MRIETLAAHAGVDPDSLTGAVTPPIHLSTIYERDSDGAYSRGYSYQRKDNPTRKALERTLCALEGGAAAAAFASGSAATTAVFQTLARGDHVVAPGDAYYGTRVILNDCLTPWGLDVTYVDMSDLDAVRRAVRPQTRMLWVESPSNPLLTISDFAGIADVARGAGALFVCDNTLATPVLSRPFELGADLVMHATTKYLGGHSDVLGGAVVARAAGEPIERIRHLQHALGAVPSPFDCWLVLRGIRSLPYRMRAHCANALRVAQYLADHSAVEKVHYPGLPGHPGHALASRQMAAYGGLLSFQVKGDARVALAVAARCRVFTRATSFGGPESLIEHRASIEGPGTAVPQNLLRMSVGLEHPDDLIEDLAQALPGA